LVTRGEYTQYKYIITINSLNNRRNLLNAQLTTAGVTSRLSNLAGRAIVTARGHHFIVDSPPPLGGPNEEINPIDILLSALATCGTFIFETYARETSIPLHSITITAAGDFDPRGLCGDPVDPRLQHFRVKADLSGPTQDQVAGLIEAFKTRCPVYTTLVRSAPIDIEVNLIS
jgi:putative redox protein